VGNWLWIETCNVAKVRKVRTHWISNIARPCLQKGKCNFTALCLGEYAIWRCFGTESALRSAVGPVKATSEPIYLRRSQSLAHRNENGSRSIQLPVTDPL
jgi:hypothetical protein